MKFFIMMVLFLVPVANADVVINGTRYSTDEVYINFTEEGSTPTPNPEPEPPEGDCTPSQTQVCGNTVDWTNFGPQITVGLVGTNEVISWPFSTTDSSSYKGYVTISETVQQGSVSREMWFSTDPSGPAISTGCMSTGISTRTIWWSQGYVRGYPCRLDTSNQYFLNVQNTAGCASGSTCTFIRNFGS